jgi:predicted HAD superfamily phosphohydrolase YqeG
MSKPIIVQEENRILCDVDETLIENISTVTKEEYKSIVNNPSYATVISDTNNTELLVPYYDAFKIIKPKQAVISFVRSLKSRGYHVTVQSNNGWQWAWAVVVALEMENCVDMVATKPAKCIDDAPDLTHVIGTLIHPDSIK